MLEHDLALTCQGFYQRQVRSQLATRGRSSLIKRVCVCCRYERSDYCVDSIHCPCSDSILFGRGGGGGGGGGLVTSQPSLLPH